MAGVSFYNLPAVSVAPFSPSDLLNLEAWYKADAGITTVSSAVSVWADQSGNGRDVTQGVVSSRPAYGSVTLNGINVLSFDGTEFLNSASISSHNFWHTGSSTVFIVAHIGKISNPNAIYSLIGNNALTDTLRGNIIIYDDRATLTRNNMLLIRHTNGIASNEVVLSLNNNALTPSAWSILTTATDTAAAATDRLDYYVDTTKYDGINTNTGSPSVSNASYVTQIGANGVAALDFVGYMAEIIMYSRKLSDLEIGQVHTYLKNKYGL